MKIMCELVKGRDLKPGDLFSIYGPEYWDTALDKGSIGEKVYIRTNVSADQSRDDPETLVYRITTEGE